MVTWEDIVQRYLCRHSDRIRRVTKPLRDYFHVDYFTYHKIDADGHYSVLLDRPDWAEHYVSNKFYLIDPYLRHPDVYESGVCLLQTNGTEEYQSTVVKDGFELFGMDLGMLLIEKSEGSVEFFSCSGSSKNGGIYDLYMSDLGLLKAFTQHFKQELQPLLMEMQKAPMFLTQLKGEDFFRKTPIVSKTNTDERHAFLKDIGLCEEIKRLSRLSPREKDCLLCLIKDYNAKESASALGISQRTIEFYFENIKDKLGCISKKEIYSLAKEWSALGLL